MCIMLVGVLFFCLETKEKIPKEKLKAALPGLLRHCHCRTGLQLASLKQSPLTRPWQCLRWRSYDYAGGLRGDWAMWMQCAINVILSIKAKTDSTIISEIYMIWIANFVSKYFSTSYFHILLFIYLNISTPNPLTLYSSSPLFAAWSPGLTVGAST